MYREKHAVYGLQVPTGALEHIPVDKRGTSLVFVCWVPLGVCEWRSHALLW